MILFLFFSLTPLPPKWSTPVCMHQGSYNCCNFFSLFLLSLFLVLHGIGCRVLSNLLLPNCNQLSQNNLWVSGVFFSLNIFTKNFTCIAYENILYTWVCYLAFYFISLYWLFLHCSTAKLLWLKDVILLIVWTSASVNKSVFFQDCYFGHLFIHSFHKHLLVSLICWVLFQVLVADLLFL